MPDPPHSILIRALRGSYLQCLSGKASSALYLCRAVSFRCRKNREKELCGMGVYFDRLNLMIGILHNAKKEGHEADGAVSIYRNIHQNIAKS